MEITYLTVVGLALLSQVIAYLAVRFDKQPAIRLGSPLNIPSWEFSSLITNLGITASVTVPALTLLDTFKKTDNDYARWSLAAGILIWFAPLVFLMWRGNSAPPGSAPAYFGYVVFYLGYATCAIGGLACQLELIGLLLESGKNGMPAQTVSMVLRIAAGVVIVYGTRTSYLILMAAGPANTKSLTPAPNSTCNWSLL